jgi:spermidine synthase
MSNQRKSQILKVALFCTGLSGIVAEYILSTLATYFLGNSVLQWTMILSIMLFSMGLGSRISRYIEQYLLATFVVIEFVLSVLVSFSALITYTAAAYTEYLGLIIYLTSILIGLLIGMEIPLVTRLNESFETLRVNIATVMEKDYYGSLLGGVFFAFVGLPYLGLTYTPFILGFINFSVAVVMYFMLREVLEPRQRKRIWAGGLATALIIALGLVFAEPIVMHGEQKNYKDKIVYSEQTRYQKIVVTEWKGHHWLYLDMNPQLSSFDEYLYHEPLVHPAMKLVPYPRNVLILGGGDGCALREVLKYEAVEQVTLVDLDPAMTELGSTHPVFTQLNQGAFSHPKVQVINQDAYQFMKEEPGFYDVIIVDFPDPKTIELGRLYSLEFYMLCYKYLRPRGAMIVQAGSPYYASRAFLCIEKTIREAGFAAIPLHNQVLTMGQWGWVLGAKSWEEAELKPILRSMHFNDVPTRWLTHDAMYLITSFGKNLVQLDSSKVEINTIHNPVLPGYYRNGNWDLY